MAVINTNIMSLNAQRNLSATQSALATSVQRLSTGLRVNTAKDDAAGLAIAERMGHEAVDITYRYAHLFPTKQDEMAAALDGARG